MDRNCVFYFALGDKGTKRRESSQKNEGEDDGSDDEKMGKLLKLKLPVLSELSVNPFTCLTLPLI